MSAGRVLIGISTVLVLVLVGGSLFFTQPKRLEFIALCAENETVNAHIKLVTSRLVNIRSRSELAQKELTKVHQQVHQRLDSLPTLGNVPDLAKNIVDRGAGFGLEFVSVLPLHDTIFMKKMVVSAVNGRQVCELPIQVKVRGRFRQLAHYLEALRDIPYYSRADDVELKLQERPGSQGLLEMTVHLTIFYLDR